MVRVKAYAKLNLTLAITGREGGYHTLDSLVCTVDMFDLIKLKRRKDNLVTVQTYGRECELLDFEHNNAAKAAQRYVERFSTRGADIVIYKNIPVGAGMGGSSADAAGVLRGMSKLYGAGSERELKELADGLGSDTGYLLTGGFARLTGRGEVVQPIEFKKRLHFVLLLPRSGVSTPDCYALYDEMGLSGGDYSGAYGALYSGDIAALAGNMGNDLFKPAARLNGDVARAYGELESFSPLGVNMTGSGSGVFAVFENADFCGWAKSRYKGKFECVALKSVVPKL